MFIFVKWIFEKGIVSIPLSAKADSPLDTISMDPNRNIMLFETEINGDIRERFQTYES